MRSLIGARVQSYELVSLLGKGGMAEVYLARHRVTGREAAVKVLRLEHAVDDEQVARFLDEAKAVAAIRHRNIIDIVDLGRLVDSGRPYLLMELLQGETLAARLGVLGCMPVAQALHIARQAASALAAAHGKGIVHRDVKPENLFLVPDPTVNGGVSVKLLDFGIAKLDPDLRGLGWQTTTGHMFGTPTYMSPEQCRGRTRDIDHRSDVYSLAVVLYEMLCGRPPFVREARGDVLAMHMNEAPVPPRSLNPDVPPAIEASILKALAKAPQDRFATMDAFAATLVDKPVRKVTAETLRTFVVARRAALAIVTAALLVVAGAAIARRTSAPPDVYLEPARADRADAPPAAPVTTVAPDVVPPVVPAPRPRAAAAPAKPEKRGSRAARVKDTAAPSAPRFEKW